MINFFFVRCCYRYNGTYEYPWWGIVFGWILALTSILQLPISILYFWFTAPNIPKVSNFNSELLTTTKKINFENYQLEMDLSYNWKSKS